jgi:hypothetical protein
MHEAGYDISLALFRSLRLVPLETIFLMGLVRNPSDSCPRFVGDQFGIEERFSVRVDSDQTSWNDKIKKDSIPIPGKRTSQNDVLETNTMPCLYF